MKRIEEDLKQKAEVYGLWLSSLQRFYVIIFIDFYPGTSVIQIKFTKGE